MDLSNTVKIKDKDIYISKNNEKWYETALKYDHKHPEANYYYASQLEEKGCFKDAYNHYRTSFYGGFNAAIIGLLRTKGKDNQVLSEKKKGKSKGVILGIIILLILAFMIILLLLSSYRGEEYRTFRLMEVESRVVEREVWLHRVPVSQERPLELFADSIYIALNIKQDYDVNDILFFADEYIRKQKKIKDKTINLVFYCSNNNIAAQVVWDEESGGLSDIYVFPDFIENETTKIDKLIRPSIVIDTKSHILTYYAEDGRLKSYPIGVGKASTPTPVGSFTIKNKVLNPKSYRQDVSDEAYGVAWLGLSQEHYGIHGTNNNLNIGRDVTAGCINMRNDDIKELYNMVEIGTPVIIK